MIYIAPVLSMVQRDINTYVIIIIIIMPHVTLKQNKISI